MQSKSLRNLLTSAAGILLLLCAFTGGLIVGWTNPIMPGMPGLGLHLTIPFLSPSSKTSSSSSTNLPKLFEPFWYTWTFVHEQYIDQPVNDETLLRGALRGMLDALGDPHTAYMDPQLNQQTSATLQGDYEGIGAYVDSSGSYLKIIAPMTGSPAQKAGLQSGDLIVAVDGKDVTGMDGGLVLQKILGPAGTSVRLTIQRSGMDKPFDVTIVRAKILLPSVDGKMLGNNIAYVHIYTFGDNTLNELKSTLQTLLAKKPSGMILDLRNNGGGLLDTAVDVVSQFIPANKVVVYEQYGNGSRQTLTTKGGGLATANIPLIVLVNEGTASASEITAGAIQDYKRGQLVGVTTYGKGSVQSWATLTNNEGAIRVTVAHWLTPNQRLIDKIGLKPDVEVKITQDDINAGRDPQLDKAVQLLTTLP
ncbi:MAG: S41 family peptidase [Anaerolineaceae bacterium]|nr:S41 family peptidase [Anaerolineaceae bacterium]